jgi:DHA2 family multidrug resistance protein
MGYAASLFSMIRNTGAAVGVSGLTTMLVRHQQIHQSHLIEHFSLFDAWRMGMAPARMPGAPLMHHLSGQFALQTRGVAMVYNMVQAQAAILAFDDIYRMMLWITVIAIPPLLLLWLWANSKVVRSPATGAAALAH